MSTQPPPVPPANRSDKGPGNAEGAPKDDARTTAPVSDKAGQQANTRLNTTQSGHQQDR